MLLRDLDRYFQQILDINAFSRADRSLNGLQLGDEGAEITKAAFAVDACMASFERAVEQGAQLLFVHHGLFWGAPLAVTGGHYHRVKYLLDNGLALYAVHLPLDAHSEVGNNAGLADALGLVDRQPWGEYKGLKIGLQGRLAEKTSRDKILSQLKIRREECLGFFSFGPAEVETVALISGGGALEVLDAIAEGFDLYITGEISHQIYHACAEGQMNMIAAGHYHTETYGVQRMAEKVTSELGIETFFIDTPTGL